MQKIILASGSPRRKQLLEWAEIEFEIIPSNADEDFPPGLNITDIPVFVARNKAAAVRHSATYSALPRKLPILAADTIVVLNGEVIGKPAGREDAINMLLSLSGQKHLVITGVILEQGEQQFTFADTTEVEFHPLNLKDIEFYVDKYQPYDKAGAYAIQEWIGVVGIRNINGDFYNVMGLPVNRVVDILRKNF